MSCLVSAHRDDGGDWQFLPGVEVSEADATVVSLAQVLERDHSVALVADLKPGFFAIRPSSTEPLHLQQSASNDE